MPFRISPIHEVHEGDERSPSVEASGLDLAVGVALGGIVLGGVSRLRIEREAEDGRPEVRASMLEFLARLDANLGDLEPPRAVTSTTITDRADDVVMTITTALVELPAPHKEGGE